MDNGGENIKKDNANVVALPPIIFLTPLIVGILIDYFFMDIPIFAASAPKWIIGSSLFLLGIFLTAWALILFKKAGENPDPRKPTNALITNGPFAYFRNPIYLSDILIYAGISTAANTYWPFFFLPVVLVIIEYGVVRREEKYMENKFGEEYRRYKSRVRRWF